MYLQCICASLKAGATAVSDTSGRTLSARSPRRVHCLCVCGVTRSTEHSGSVVLCQGAIGTCSSGSGAMFGFGRSRQEKQPATATGRTSLASNNNSRATAQPVAPGVPLELVRYDTDSGKFHVGEQALQMLRTTKDPVGVVAVCGRARQGKSFILNQLLGQSTGFQVAPSVRPCTKGLWMWSSPITRKNADGSQYQLVRDVADHAVDSLTCCTTWLHAA